MKIFLAKELANTICPYLQMTVDYPSKNPSGWMPILDLAVRMASDNSVDFKWYKKPVATDYSILNRSAMPAARVAEIARSCDPGSEKVEIFGRK